MLCYFGGLSRPPFSVSTADTCVSGGGISLLTSFRCMGITKSQTFGAGWDPRGCPAMAGLHTRFLGALLLADRGDRSQSCSEVEGRLL